MSVTDSVEGQMEQSDARLRQKFRSRQRSSVRQALLLMIMMTGLTVLAACEDGGATTNNVLLEHMGSTYHRAHGR
jgi:transposase